MPVQKRYRAKAIQAAHMLASGEHTYMSIAAELGVERNTVAAWMKDQTILAEYREMIKTMVLPGFADSIRLLVKQVRKGETKGKEWLGQNAAREIANRFGPGIMGADENDVVVRFENGQQLPVIGMPQQPEDE